MKSLSEFLKKIQPTGFLKGVQKTNRAFIDPLREWTVCLGVTTLGAIALLGYLGLDFYLQSQEVGEPVIADHKVATYDKKEVAEILRVFSEREERFVTLRRVRPSLPEASSEPRGVEGGAASSTLAGDEGEQYTSPQQ